MEQVDQNLKAEHMGLRRVEPSYSSRADQWVDSRLRHGVIPRGSLSGCEMNEGRL